MNRAPGRARLKNLVEAASSYSGLAAARRRLHRRRGGSVILVYHQVSDEVQHPGHAAEMITGAREFAEQVEILARSGAAVPLAEAVEAGLAESPGPPRLAVTFDDGYAGVATAAAPVLRALGIPFALFVSTAFPGSRRRFPGEEKFAGVEYPKLGWDEIARLADSGATIGAHGVTHARLTALPPGQAEEEIVRSKEEIERRIGRKVAYFAYPYGGPGDWSAETERMIVAAGYEACFLCAGTGEPPASRWRIDRMPVWRGMSARAFRNLCDGADTARWVTRTSRFVRGAMGPGGRGR